MGSSLTAPTREATLTLLLRQGENTAANLASSLGISVQAMRRHLRSLEMDGLVQSSAISRGPGRPLNLWELTAEGHSHFHDGSGSFAIDLLGLIETSMPDGSVASLLDEQSIEKATYYRKEVGEGALTDRLNKLVELRCKEGYLAECEEAPDGKGWFIRQFHCSIKGIAEAYPIVCDHELEMIRRTFPDCVVERVQWRLEEGHSCGFLVSLVSND